MKQDNRQTQLILCLFGILPVAWLGLLIAPAVSGGLPEIITAFPAAMNDPFHIVLCEDSLKTVLIALCAYGMGIGIYFSTRRNYRKGEEHGSAKWGDARAVDKKYRDKRPEQNKLFTQNVRMGLDGRKHRRNLNTVVIGGSGAGKSFNLAKPNLMQANTSFVVLDPKGELVRDAVLSLSRQKMCQMAVLKFQQLDGLNTVLPIGTRKINAFRTLTTESLAVFMPFKVQEIQDKGGIYFGENAISHNLIMCNKANLLNQSAFLLGVPGSGKSFSAKELIAFLMLNTEDDILICDPEGEFAPLVEAMGSDIGTVISVAAGGKDRLNAMYMVEGYGENNPIVEKSQFIMSLVEQIDKHGVGPQHKSIIDRCTALVYQEAEETGIIPTLCTLREKLMEQPEEKAREIALSLELFTTGSLDIFGHGSNVDLDKRVVVFNIHDLGEQLKPTGLLVITDTMLNRVTLNWKRGKRTHVFIDEFHVVFENEYSGNFFNSAWRQFRKRNAYPTAITQNVEYLLDSVQASTMLSNSEFIVMLNQAASDREKLARLLNISNEQMSYVTNADAGCGLIKYGSALVPFVNRFPKDTQLYKLMTTKPGEGVFGGEGKEVTA